MALCGKAAIVANMKWEYRLSRLIHRSWCSVSAVGSGLEQGRPVEAQRMGTSLEEYMTRNYAGKRKGGKTKARKAEDREKTAERSAMENRETRVESVGAEKPESGCWIDLQTKEKVAQPCAAGAVSRKPKGGLQDREELVKDIDEREKKMQEEIRSMERLGGLMHTVVHRDESGRRLTEEEAKTRNSEKGKKRSAEKREEHIAKRNRNEAGILREEQMRERLKQIKTEGINVYENDEKLAKSQMEEIKSEDPALLFDKNIIKKHKKQIDKQFVSISGRKLYPDASRYPVNRFGIKPGWRWDGIVRGNGFEQKWMKAQTKK